MNTPIDGYKMKAVAPWHLAIVQPILLFTFVFTLQNFLGSLFHEGGHALVIPANGEKITSLVVHPFTFAGYTRPIWDYYNVWTHISEPLAGVLIPLLIFVLLWKRRSTNLLPLLLLFPFGIIFEGINALQPGSGDFNNLIQITGMSAVPIRGLGLILVGVGIFFTISFFPLFGLAPQDKKSLFIVPAGFFLMSMLGLIVANIFVPASPLIQTDNMVAEVMNSATTAAIFIPVIGFLLALIYVSLYRRLYPRLPVGLRTETVSLTWKDLQLPSVLAAICMILGILIIT